MRAALRVLILAALALTAPLSLAQGRSGLYNQAPELVYGKRYGMVCDGTTDDTAAFAAARTAGYGKLLVLPAGTCMIDPTTLSSAISIQGQGIGKTILKANASVAATAVLNSNSAAVSGIELRDFTLDVNRAANGGNAFLSGVRVGDPAAGGNTSSRFIMERVRVTGSAQHNVQLIRHTGARVSNSELDDHSTFGIVLFRACLDCVVEGNYIHTTQAGAYGIASDDRSTDSTTSESGRRVVIANNTLEGGGAGVTAIDVEGGLSHAVTGNTIRDWTTYGIDINSSNADSVPDASSNFNVVAGNAISGIGNAGAGINIEGSGNVVANNAITSGGAIGIQQQIPNENTLGAKNNVISGNTITANAGAGILVYAADGLVIANNVLSDVTHYGIRLVALAAGSGGGAISNVSVTGNLVRSTLYSAIAVESNTNNISEVNVVGNTVIDWDTAAASTRYGLELAKGAGTVSNVALRSNMLIKTGATGLVGVRIPASVTGVALSGNTAINLTTNFSDASAAEAKTYNRGNTWNQKEVYGTAAPATGTWAVGDIVWNSAPAAGGTLGWVCTTGGSPGTWKAFGGIAP